MKLGKTLIEIINKIVVFIGIITALLLIGSGVINFYRISLQKELVPNVSAPVARFLANVDYKERTVQLDATISKTADAEKKIIIWRFGDGKIKKADNHSLILENEALEYMFKEPGSYQVSYSIIDTNDLSDEAFCTITFNEKDELGSVNDSCGKSFTSYNQEGGIYAINETQREIRSSLLYVGVGIAGLIGTLILSLLIKRIFIGKVSESKKNTEKID